MYLCIDTVTEFAGVALVGDIGQCRFQKLDSRHASDRILESIDQVLQKANAQSSDLKGVFVIKGPGSFTGLRVGIAVANQFSHQLKIPIVGLRTDEWYSYRTDEKDFVYLQTMNRDQVYMVGFGKFKNDFSQSIISISECHHELVPVADLKWLGQVNDEHNEKLSDIKRLIDLHSPDIAWQRVVENIKAETQKTYQLVEPFYGKEPTITKSKRKLNM